MHIEFLLEESSAAYLLERLVPKIVGDSVSLKFHAFQGKPDLLNRLPDRLRGYANWLPNDWRIVVLVDRDNDDCHELKRKIQSMIEQAGLTTKPAKGKGADYSFQVLCRIAIEEIEAWFFGDIEALRNEFPRIPPTLKHRQGFRVPDAIKGGTWEALERVLKKENYYPTGLAKNDFAKRIAPQMNPDRNQSRSFQAFRDGLRALVRQNIL